MNALPPEQSQLLDFLCAAKQAHCRVKKLKTYALNGRAKSLRASGHVKFNSNEPSWWAFRAWQKRNMNEPASRKSCPSARAHLADCDTDPGFEPGISPANARRYSKSSTSLRIAVPTASRCREDKNTPNERAVKTRPPVDLKVNAAVPKQKPDTPILDFPEKQRQRAQRKEAARKRTNRQKAEAFLDSGKTSTDAKNVSLHIEARKVELQRANEARLNDSVEQAKSLLRRHYKPVLNAETMGGPVGKFIVGRHTVTEAELLALAERKRA